MPPAARLIAPRCWRNLVSVVDWPFYVYMHRRKSTGEPFYIGKGHLRAKDMAYGRANDLKSRNPIWGNIAKKYDVIVEILAHCKTDREALDVECYWVTLLGRINLKTGPLANLTDGGDGHKGIVASKNLRKIRSKNASNPRSKAWVESIRFARKNGGNGGVVKKGDKLPKSWCESISKAVSGENNHFFGKATSISKKVINIKTKVIHPSIYQAASAEGVNRGHLYGVLQGLRKNDTPLRLLSAYLKENEI